MVGWERVWWRLEQDGGVGFSKEQGLRRRWRGVVAQALERGEGGGWRRKGKGKDEIRLGCPGFHFLYRKFTIIPLI